MQSVKDEQTLRKSCVYLLCLNMIDQALKGIGSVNSISDKSKLSNLVFDEFINAIHEKKRISSY